jgi:serpin B/serpin B11/12
MGSESSHEQVETNTYQSSTYQSSNVFAQKSFKVAEQNLSSNVLAQKLSKVTEPNTVYSPLSIAYILSLLHLGAVNNTETQITNLMTRKNSLDNLFEWSSIFNSDNVKLTNAILVNQMMPIKKEYLQIIVQLAHVSNENFSQPDAIVRKVNSLIEQETNNLIKDILKEEMIHDDTVMVLINTIYFKIAWDKPFKKQLTRKEKFNQTQVDMMTQTQNYPYYEDQDIQLVELLYYDGLYRMGIILPKENVPMSQCATYLGQNISCNHTSVEVHIPKFTQRKKTDLVPLMKKMGVTDLFSQEARLDNMIEITQPVTYVSTMVHEAVVVIDEIGTEAAATTVAVMRLESCSRTKREPVVFYANHPFMYYIKHVPTKTLLFVGDFHGI